MKRPFSRQKERVSKTRIIAMSDLHCGHKVGLTHPDFNVEADRVFGPHSRRLWRLRKDSWGFFASRIASLGEIDLCLAVGDLLDGRGKGSGARELLTIDRNEQVEMAIAGLEQVNAKEYALAYGTRYHTGKREDWEIAIAKHFDAPIDSHATKTVNGRVIDYRHKVGSSSVPYGRHTQIAKDNVWNLIWAARGEQLLADIIIRAHIHYYTVTGNADWIGFTLPALQLALSDYGTREKSGTVDFGFLEILISEDGAIEYYPHIKRFTDLVPER